MSAHTPGPWRVVTDGIAFPKVVEANGWGICHTNYAPTNALQNARLIAAAPELLAALKDLTLNVNEAMKTGGWVPTPLHASFWDSMADALGAIAKAEGAAQ